MKEYIERSEQESILKKRYYELAGMRPDFYAGYMTAFHIIENDIPNAADVIEADRLGRVGRLMLPYKGCPRGPIGRLGMAGGKTQDKKAILVEELCCMDTFEDVDGNVWRPVQEEVLQEVIEMLRNMEETVHCKDCRYCIPVAADNAEYELCIVDNDVFPVSVQKQHFCGRGKRKEE